MRLHLGDLSAYLLQERLEAIEALRLVLIPEIVVLTDLVLQLHILLDERGVALAVFANRLLNLQSLFEEDGVPLTQPLMVLLHLDHFSQLIADIGQVLFLLLESLIEALLQVV